MLEHVLIAECECGVCPDLRRKEQEQTLEKEEGVSLRTGYSVVFPQLSNKLHTCDESRSYNSVKRSFDLVPLFPPGSLKG